MRIKTQIFSLIVFISLRFEYLSFIVLNETNGSRVLALIVGFMVLGGIALSFISQVNHKGGRNASGRDYSNHQQIRSDSHAFLIL
jgi:hypothetical protein